jgi:hypothetical protein
MRSPIVRGVLVLLLLVGAFAIGELVRWQLLNATEWKYIPDRRALG